MLGQAITGGGSQSVVSRPHHHGSNSGFGIFGGSPTGVEVRARFASRMGWLSFYLTHAVARRVQECCMEKALSRFGGR